MAGRIFLLLWVPPILATLVALFSVLRVLFPGLVSGAQAAAARMPGRATVLGIVNVLFLLVLAGALSAVSRGGLLQLLALLLTLLLAVAAAFGLAAMSPLLGAGLLPDASPTRQSVWGAIALLVACLTPVLGWFLLFPYLACRGLGGLVIHLFTR